MTTATLEPDATTSPQAVPAPAAPPRRRRVLMLTHRMPYPPDRGDRIRTYHMVKALAQQFDVAIGCTTEDPAWLQHHQLLASIAKRVSIQPISMRINKMLGVAGLVCGQAVTPSCFYRQGLADAIKQWHEQEPFDAVLTVCTSMIKYARLLVRKPRKGEAARTQPKHVIDLMDVDSAKWRAYARSTWSPMKWVYATEARRLRRVEAGEFDHFDAITLVSPAEVQAYRQYVGEHPNVMSVGNGVDLDYFAPQPDANSKTIVFVGVLNYKPNSDGIAWFAHNVMGPLRQRVADARLLIVGRHPTPQIMELNRVPGVEVVGSVPDVRAYIRESVAVVAPLMIARGIQNKILEGMSCARAVVCSPDAAEGISAHAGEHFLVASNPQEWADMLERLLTQPAYRRQIGEAARTLVAQSYSWERQLQPMIDLLGS